MIIAMFLKVIMMFLAQIIIIINTLFPSIDIGTNLTRNIALILNISEQSLNFVHFIVR